MDRMVTSLVPAWVEALLMREGYAVVSRETEAEIDRLLKMPVELTSEEEWHRVLYAIAAGTDDASWRELGLKVCNLSDNPAWVTLKEPARVTLRGIGAKLPTRAQP